MTRGGSDQLRFSMTLPGSASLGAFQAGAIAALAVAITSLRSSGRHVSVDAIGGSSAGSIVAMLAAHCLLTGKDAPALLKDAWVEHVDVELLRAESNNAPLGFDELRSSLSDFLGDESHSTSTNEPLADPIVVHVGLTALQGFTTSVRTGASDTPTLTYADGVDFTLQPEHVAADLTEPDGASVLDAVLTSASHPGGFAPRRFDRGRNDPPLEANELSYPGDSDVLWYTDGGLVESSPVGDILDAARSTGGEEGTRVHLVIDPRSSGVHGNAAWSDPDADHSWVDGLRRAISILPTQALHDDLRRIADLNDTLARIDSLAVELAGESGLDENELASRLREAAGIDGKAPIVIEMISPLLVADGDNEGASDLLAGDFIGAFGGFLNKKIRRSDFALGWQSTTSWTVEALPRLDFSDDECRAVAEALADADVDSWVNIVPDGDGTEQLSLSDRLRLTRLGLRAGRLLAGEALPSVNLLERIRDVRNGRAADATEHEV